MILVDTNVLLYASGGEHPLREPARRLMAAIVEGRVGGTTAADVIQEFAHVSSRRRPREEAVSNARRYAAILAPLVSPRAEDLEAGLRLFARDERLGAFDAVLAATAIGQQVTAFVSADRAFEGVPKLPFVALGSPELDRLLG